jgi:hypothetical protein
MRDELRTQHLTHTRKLLGQQLENPKPSALLRWHRALTRPRISPAVLVESGEEAGPERTLPGRLTRYERSVYLVRPDGYVAVAEPGSRAARIGEFLDAWKVAPRKRGG